MDVPTTKEPLLQRMRAAYDEFDAAAGSVPSEQLETAGAAGDWSVRDLLAHTSDRWLVAQLEASREGRLPTALECYGSEKPPPPPAGADLSTPDGRNAWQHARDLGLTLEEIRERTREVRARLIALVEGYRDEDLATPYAIVELPLTGQLRPALDGEPFAAPLWRWIQGNSWHHHEDHARGIRDFVERLQAGG